MRTPIDGARCTIGPTDAASGARGRSAAVVVALAVALAGAGCAPVAVLPYVADRPPTVTLPIAQAGIEDARAGFAAVFAAQRRAAGAGAGGTGADTVSWLNGLGSAAAAPAREGADEAVRALERAFAARAAGTAVLIVPGLFGDCVGDQSLPFGDGVVRDPDRNLTQAYAQYRDLGLRTIRAVPLRGRASSAHNAGRLATEIRAETARAGVDRVVLVAYSKGVADTLQALTALERDGGVPKAVSALVSIAGVVMGTPIADSLEWLYGSISPHVDPLRCTPSDGHDLGSVTRRERIAWLAANPPPPRVRYYSVVAHAPGDAIAPPLRPFYRQLAAIDPRNDGQMLASDALLPGSVLLAEARADHWDVALPRDRHPNPLMRALASGRVYPREALLRALIKWVVSATP